jgi:pimeloyl-ACP methyl ester carboxylesterase
MPGRQSRWRHLVLNTFRMTEIPSAPPAQPSWLRRIALGLIVLLLFIAAIGICYENISEFRDRRFNSMPGRRVTVGGGNDGPSFDMHIYCTGAGTPAVILESGLGDSYISWRKVQPQIAAFTRVCSYDRAGIGYSDSSPRLRTSQVIAEELHWLLQKANVAPPYILVGHSMGGYDVRVFTALYRNEVAGLVLVDASHPDQENRFPLELKNMEGTWRREAEFLEYTAPFGVPRLLGLCDEDPPQRAADCNFHTAREGDAELRAFPISANQARAAGTLGDLPLAVLSHDPDKPSADLPPDLAKPINEAWEKMQEELARLSTRGTQIIAKGSSHYIQNDRPEVVVEAIRNVVNQARAQTTSSSPKL